MDRIYERLEALDASTAEKRAAEILFGLGFNKQMQAKKTLDFSGACEDCFGKSFVYESNHPFA